MKRFSASIFERKRQFGLVFVGMGLIIAALYFSRIKIAEDLDFITSGRTYSGSEIIAITPLGRTLPYNACHELNGFRVRGAYINKIYVLTTEPLTQADTLWINSKSFLVSDLLNTKTSNQFQEPYYLYQIPYSSGRGVIARFWYVLASSCQQVYLFVLSLIVILMISFSAKDQIIRRLSDVMLLGVLIWGYFWLFLTSYYAFPNGEELLISATSHKLGTLTSVEQLLATYDGRYVTNLFHSINPFTLLGLQYYKFLPSITICASVFAIWFLLSSMFSNSVSQKKLLIVSLVLVLIHYSAVSSLYCYLYWVYFSYVHQYPWIITFLWLGFFFRYYKADNYRKKLIFMVLAIIFMLISIGLNEIFIVLHASILFVIAVIFSHKGKQYFFDVLPMLITGLFAIALFIVLTLNGSRFILAQNSHIAENNLWFYILTNAKLWGNELLRLKTSGAALLTGILIIVTYLVEGNPNFITKAKSQRLFLWSLAIIVVLFGMSLLFVISAATNSSEDSRVFNSLFWGVQIALVFWMFLLCFEIFKKFSIKLIGKIQYVLPLLVILFAFALIRTNNNISTVISENRSRLIFGFYSENQIKLETIKSSMIKITPTEMNENFARCHLPYIFNYLQMKHETKSKWRKFEFQQASYFPNSLQYNKNSINIRPNRSADVFNLAWELYFNVDEVRLIGDSINKLDLYLNSFAVEVERCYRADQYVQHEDNEGFVKIRNE